MARLPTVGGDDGNWGTLLNQFLQVSHNTDGTLKNITVWTPSDATGATDMTSELEAFRAANLGKLIKVVDGSTILLKNAFGSVTSGDILLDFSNCTILYDHNTVNDYAIKCDNLASVSSEVSVSSLALATVNTDATVSQITLGSTLNAQRFDWIALYSSDTNPAIAGTGFYGEIFQLLSDEASLVLTATRQLNHHSRYTTSIKARKLDSTRKVYIKGGTIKANGNTEDQSITTRSLGILVRGFVDPIVENVTFDHPWGVAIMLAITAQARMRNITVKDVGNLGNALGFTYGVHLWGMNDGADIRDLVVRNGRHAAFTTGGDTSGSSLWYLKGIPTNALVTNIHAFNSHAAAIDTHEMGDNILFDGIYNAYSYQDGDINPNSSSVNMGVQLRCSRVTVRNYFNYGGAGGIHVVPVDFGFEDRVHLENIHIGELTVRGATVGNDTDQGVKIDSQASLTNKRHVFFEGVIDNAGIALYCGQTAKLTVRGISARRINTFLDAQAGSTVIFTGPVELDYRNDTRTAPYYAVKSRSDATNGGSTVIFMKPPSIIKGSDNSPLVLFLESDTTATKNIYSPGFVEYNPNSVTPTLYTLTSATTFAQVPIATRESLPITLTDAATIATNALLGKRFRVTLGGNRTLGNPTNGTDGQMCVWEIIQDATGSRTLSLGTKFAFGTDIPSITLSTTASKRDFLTAIYNSSADKWYVVNFVKGY